MSENSLLHYYDPCKPLFLQCDASLRGVGAALLQPDADDKLKPVAYASKSLTPTEQRYACIERELLSIVFGTERFHVYLYGRNFSVITDHRPLVMINDKPISSAPTTAAEDDGPTPELQLYDDASTRVRTRTNSQMACRDFRAHTTLQ